VKLVVVGGGGFRVPLVYGALLRRRQVVKLDEVVLHDIDGERLQRIAGVLEDQAVEQEIRLSASMTSGSPDCCTSGLGPSLPI